MSEIQNLKREYDPDEGKILVQATNELKRFFHQFLKNQNDLTPKSKLVLVIEYCNLRFYSRLHGDVLVLDGHELPTR